MYPWVVASFASSSGGSREDVVFRFPPPSLPRFDLIQYIGVNAVAIGLTAVAIHLTVAKIVEKRYKYKINHGQVPSVGVVSKALTKAERCIHLSLIQELYALGFVGVLSSFFPVFPVTSGFARSVVGAAVGSSTQVVGVLLQYRGLSDFAYASSVQLCWPQSSLITSKTNMHIISPDCFRWRACSPLWLWYWLFSTSVLRSSTSLNAFCRQWSSFHKGRCSTNFPSSASYGQFSKWTLWVAFCSEPQMNSLQPSPWLRQQCFLLHLDNMAREYDTDGLPWYGWRSVARDRLCCIDYDYTNAEVGCANILYLWHIKWFKRWILCNKTIRQGSPF